MAKKTRDAVPAHSSDQSKQVIPPEGAYSTRNGVLREAAAACPDLAVKGGADAGADGREAGIGSLKPTTLKELRKRSGHTQEELAAALGVGQDTISRLEKRSDMLLSTLQHYIENIGGRLSLVATFAGQPPVLITHHGNKNHPHKKRGRKPQEGS